MNAALKSIISHVICFFIGIIIGGSVTGYIIYNGSKAKIDRLNELSNRINQSFADTQKQLADSEKRSHELEGQLKQSIDNANRIDIIATNSNTEIDRIIELSQRTRDDIQKIISP